MARKSKAGDAGGKQSAREKPKKSKKLPFDVYNAELLRLQEELSKLQAWVQHRGLRIVVVFEGRDAAGKGGLIKRLTERVSPRVFRVVALPAPSDREKSQLYFQRYLQHFPAAGEVVVFDRSWYNRAGVERVMGFATESQYRRFIKNCKNFERWVVEDGIILIKYWLTVGEREQRERFNARILDPMKHWKLSPMDIESRRRWYEYSLARDAMFEATDTEYAPWYIVRADDKRRSRLNCITHLLSLVSYQELPPKKATLPKRDMKFRYDDEAALEARRWIPDRW
jgi:polyphosphate kinase 2